MDWRELLSSLEDKLTPDEKEYLAAHPLQDILADETKLCDDPAVGRKLCKQVIHREILQAIQLTQKCPGALTSYMYVSGYAYLTQVFRGLPNRGGKVGATFSVPRTVCFPTETGKTLAFTLYKNGTPRLFRDASGAWYSWIYRLRLYTKSTRCDVVSVHPLAVDVLRVSVATLEVCFENNIKHYEDLPAFRYARRQDNKYKYARRRRERNSRRAATLTRLMGELTQEDLDVIERLHLDAYLEALVQKHKDLPKQERYLKYYQALEQLLSAIVLFTQKVPCALTTYIILQANTRIISLEVRKGKGGQAFKWAYHDTTDMASGEGPRLLFCLRYRGMPLLFLGADGRWYSITGAVEPRLRGMHLSYVVRATIGDRKQIALSKAAVDMCYRYGHDEYTTWKEIKKGGGLDELD